MMTDSRSSICISDDDDENDNDDNHNDDDNNNNNVSEQCLGEISICSCN